MKNEQHLGHFITATIFILIIFVFTFVLKPRPINFLWFVLMSLATFRLTHLFVYDEVMDFLRNYFARFETGLGKSIRDLLGCSWCVGTWAGLFIVLTYYLSYYSQFFIIILAIAGLGSFIDMVLNIWKTSKPKPKNFKPLFLTIILFLI